MPGVVTSAGLPALGDQTALVPEAASGDDASACAYHPTG